MNKIRISAAVAAAAVMLGTAPALPSVQAAAARETFGTVQHSADEIRTFWQQHPWNLTDGTSFAVQPSVTSPYAPGKMSDASQQSSLNCLNLIRYTAGLPADVTISSEYSEQAQASCLVNTLNGSQAHYPEKPAGLSDTLFQMGYEGASHSNLCTSTRALINVPYTMMIYMSDTDTSNISALGHRRWMLDPAMQMTGFGHIERYSAVYAVDMSRTASFAGDFIAWPAQNMPYQLYDGFDYGDAGYAFSVTLGPAYDTPQKSTVKVDLSSSKTGKSYHFDQSVQNEKGLYFNINTDYVGIDNCIVFNPAVMFAQDDVLTVKISGLTKNGSAAQINYQVRFFDLYAPVTEKLMFGDPDNSGTVTLADALMTLQAYSNTLFDQPTGLTALQTAAADVDGDSRISLSDALIILQYYSDHALLNKNTTWQQLGAKVH